MQRDDPQLGRRVPSDRARRLMELLGLSEGKDQSAEELSFGDAAVSEGSGVVEIIDEIAILAIFELPRRSVGAMFGRLSRKPRSAAERVWSSGHGGPLDDDEGAAREHANKLFFRAQEQHTRGDMRKAAKTFAAAEAEMERVPGMFRMLVLLRARYGWTLYELRRPDLALEVFDRAIAVIEKVKAAGAFEDNDDFRVRRPDEIAHIYWGRARSLESVRRVDEALDAIAALIQEVGSGATSVQRSYVADAYLMQARIAEKRGRFDVAFKAIDQAIARCAGHDEPELKESLRDAEQMQQSLRARVQTR